MLKTSLIVVLAATGGIFNAVNDFQAVLPMPVMICAEDPRLTEVRDALKILGRDQKYAKDIFVSATAKGIDPLLWCINVETESNYKITARSRLNYRGLGQTPTAMMRTGYEFVDLALAACVMNEKVVIAKGDMHKAMALYKGGLSPAAHREAAKVFALYEKIKIKLKEQQNG